MQVIHQLNNSLRNDTDDSNTNRNNDNTTTNNDNKNDYNNNNYNDKGPHFAHDIFKLIFLYETKLLSISIVF